MILTTSASRFSENSRKMKELFWNGIAVLVQSAVFPDARLRAADSPERLESLSRLTVLVLVYLASIY